MNDICCEYVTVTRIHSAGGGGRDGFHDDESSGEVVGNLELVPIAEVRRRTGLTRKALLVYEAAGLVSPAARTGGGYRLYDHQSLRRLELVTWARGLGLTLAEAEAFLQAAERGCSEGQRALRMLLQRKLAETAALLEELDVRRAELRREAAYAVGVAAGPDSPVARSLSSRGANA